MLRPKTKRKHYDDDDDASVVSATLAQLVEQSVNKVMASIPKDTHTDKNV